MAKTFIQKTPIQLRPLIILFFCSHLFYDGICQSKNQIKGLKADSILTDQLNTNSKKYWQKHFDSSVYFAEKALPIAIDSNKYHNIINDSSNINSDVIGSTKATLDSSPISYQPTLNDLLEKNKLLNLKQRPVSLISAKRSSQQKDYIFYTLSGIFLIFGIFKIFYSQYFNNIFRVFFNTSLRQNQLTDLLLQAKLPSLIFNVFFLIMGGFYIWLLLKHYSLINEDNTKTILPICILTISLVYIIKFCVLKFIGWVTGMIQPANTYVFVVFLVNKITGVVLLPFVILLAFTSPVLQSSVIILSYLTIGVLFLSRLIRSYSLLQNQLNIGRFHFFLYILSIEILPLLIIYKLFLKMVR